MMKNERFENTEQKPDVIAGRNPVSEAVRSNRPIDKILVAKGENLYIEINKSHDPLGQNLFVPVVVLNGIFMMEDTL